jgi:tetratricopeptide (TPR) repeat protein
LALHDLGRVRFHRGDWSGAVEAFRGALQRDADDFNSAYSLGRALLELHDERAALTAFERALGAREPAERVFLGDAFARAIGLELQFGQRDAARELALRMRARLPDDAEAARFLSSVGLDE